LGADVDVLVGVAVGYEDESHKINHIATERDTYKNNVGFMED
jgi:hypothetical protein